MEIGAQLALSHFWWTWNESRVHRAVDAAHLEHWAAVVEQDFATNRSAGRAPGDWQELLLLGRERQNVIRVAKGQSASTKQFLLGVASILRRDAETLYPDTARWVASAALYVSVCGADPKARQDVTREQWKKAVNDGAGFSRAEAADYATFMLRTPPDPRRSGEGAVWERLSRASRAVRESALVVAEHLGPVLLQISPH